MLFNGPSAYWLRLYIKQAFLQAFKTGIMTDHTSRIAYLLQRYKDKTCSRQELEELFSYIGEAEDPAELHRFMSDTYDTIPADKELPEIDYNEVYERVLHPVPVPRRYIFTWQRVAAAAVVLLLAGAATWLWQVRSNKAEHMQGMAWQSTVIAPGTNKALLTLADGSVVKLDSSGNQVIRQGSMSIRQKNGQLLYDNQEGNNVIHYNKLSTPRGGQFSVILPDGTKAWLNSASSLRYPTAFTGKYREVELEGQGYFEVAANAAQPFKLKVKGMEVRVLGTGFDVMAYPDEATANTTLLKGSVQIKGGNTLQILRPGQQAVMQNKDHSITVQETDVNKVVAWKNGLFVFNNMALPAILREIARWYDVEISYTTAPSPELYGGGISRSLQLSDVLALLEGNGYNHFRIEGRKVIVLP